MNKKSRKGPVISLGDDFDAVGDNFYAVIMRDGGVKLELSSGGSIVIYTNGDVNIRLAANDDAGPSVGDVLPDGWIYAGLSPDTGKPFSVSPADSGVMSWKNAMKFAARQGSRLPSKAELNVLYENKDKGALTGTFNETGSYPAGWYWSSSEDDGNYLARDQRFSSDGIWGWNCKDNAVSVRCVRDEPRRTR